MADKFTGFSVCLPVSENQSKFSLEKNFLPPDFPGNCVINRVFSGWRNRENLITKYGKIHCRAVTITFCRIFNPSDALAAAREQPPSNECRFSFSKRIPHPECTNLASSVLNTRPGQDRPISNQFVKCFSPEFLLYLFWGHIKSSRLSHISIIFINFPVKSAAWKKYIYIPYLSLFPPWLLCFRKCQI